MSERKRMIAVDEDLTNVRQALEEAGYKVTKITNGTMTNIGACVVSGLAANALGIQNTHGNKFPVIKAAGKSANEIVQEIQAHDLTQNVT
jgi:hypothetical protein